jgi:hypothetical protein
LALSLFYRLEGVFIYDWPASFLSGIMRVPMLSIFDKIFDKLSLSLNFLNRDQSPSNKAVVKHSSVGSVQQAGGDIHNVHITQEPRGSSRPRVDMANEFGGRGGPDGTFAVFRVKNDGTESAIDLQGEFVADDLKIGPAFDIAHSLSPGQQSRMIECRYDGTDLFGRRLANPRIIFRYKSSDGRTFESGRAVVQEPRADGRFNIHTKLGRYFESEQSKPIAGVDIEGPRFNLTSRLKEGLADAFSVTVPVLLRNYSNDNVLVRNIRQSLELPDGYACHIAHDGLNSPEGRNIPARAVLPYNLIFAISIAGRRVGVPLSQLPEWEENKAKLLARISTGKIRFRLDADAISPETSTRIHGEFDVTDSLLPQIMVAPPVLKSDT